MFPLSNEPKKELYTILIMHKQGIIILFTFLIICGCTHRFEGVEDNTPVGNMECLWRTLDEKYCFFDEKGVDWQRVHDDYLPSVKVLDEKDYLALFDTLESMVNLLNDGHVNLYSSFDVSSCTSWYANDSTNWDWEVVKTYYLKDYRRAGGAYYTTLLADSIGYMYVGDFESAISSSNMYYMLTSWSNNGCRGLIIDVRNNGGGSLDYAYQLAATFFERDTVVGYWQHKNGTGHEDFSGLEEQTLKKDVMLSTWKRPVVVLCNRRTYSAANFFVSIMRYSPYCCIIGTRSGGGGGMPMSYEMPNGWLLRFSSIRMYDRNHISIENGIEPNILSYDLSSTKQRDENIDSAIKWIKSLYKK